MKLSDWLAREKKSPTDLANEIGVRAASITRLIPREGKKQIRRPGWDLIEKIVAATQGAVTANDFMENVAESETPSRIEPTAA